MNLSFSYRIHHIHGSNSLGSQIEPVLDLLDIVSKGDEGDITVIGREDHPILKIQFLGDGTIKLVDTYGDSSYKVFTESKDVLKYVGFVLKYLSYHADIEQCNLLDLEQQVINTGNAPGITKVDTVQLVPPRDPDSDWGPCDFEILRTKQFMQEVNTLLAEKGIA